MFNNNSIDITLRPYIILCKLWQSGDLIWPKIDIYFTPKPLKRWIFVIKTLETKGFISIWNHHKRLIQLFPIYLNTYVMGLRPLEIFLLSQGGDRLYSPRCKVNPLSPHDALKHYFRSPKADLISLQQRVWKRKFPWNWSTNTWQIYLLFHPHQMIFIHK